MLPITKRRVVAYAAPFAFGAIAYASAFASLRLFDGALLRDRALLREDLLLHGAASQQVADVVAYEAKLAAAVSAYVSGATLAAIGATMFLGIILASLITHDPRDDRKQS